MKIVLLVTALWRGLPFPQPKDVDGWGPVHWGMTVDEACPSYGREGH